MDHFMYKDIIKDVMETFVNDNLAVKWIFMYDNDPKNLSKIFQNWFSIGQGKDRI